jgi:hypothetical protein
MPDHVAFWAMWKILRLWTRKMMEHFKQRLVDHPSRISQDRSSKNYVDCGGPSVIGLQGDIINDGARAHCSWDILVQNLVPSALILTTDLRLNWKFRLFYLAEEILKQSNNDTVAWVFVVTFMQVYNESESDKKKHKAYSLKRKRNIMWELRLTLKKVRRVKESPDLKCNGRGDLGERSRPAELPTYERKPKKQSGKPQMWFKVVKIYPNLAAKCISMVYLGLALESLRVHE